jgi:hypothetical protein
LRGIEVRTLTDHHVEGEVLQTNRRKGSDNLVRKGEQTEVAIKVLQDRRAAIWAKRGITQLNAPLSPKMRPLFVSEDGRYSPLMAGTPPGDDSCATRCGTASSRKTSVSPYMD